MEQCANEQRQLSPAFGSTQHTQTGQKRPEYKQTVLLTSNTIWTSSFLSRMVAEGDNRSQSKTMHHYRWGILHVS